MDVINDKCLRILQELLKHSHLSSTDLSLLLSCDTLSVTDEVHYLYINGYIESCDPEHPDKLIKLDQEFKISVKSKSYIASLNRDNRRFKIPLVISIIALAVAILSLIVSIVK